MSLGETMMLSDDSVRMEVGVLILMMLSDTPAYNAIVPTLLRFGKLPICTVIGVSYS